MPEEVTGSPGTGVIDGYEPHDRDAGNQSLSEQQATLTAEPSLQLQACFVTI